MADQAAVNLDTVDLDEASELVTESWRLRAPRRAVTAWDADHLPPRPGEIRGG